MMNRYTEFIFDEVEIEENIIFAEVVGHGGNKEKLMLDVYTPSGDYAQNRRALFLIHGGGFVTGNDKQQGYIKELANLFARLGYVCISPDYRLYENIDIRPERLIAAQEASQDVELARLFISSNASLFGIDPQNMAIVGGSAGGMTANVACIQPGAYRALVVLWGAPKTCLHPERYVDSLLIHGTADKSVDYNQSVELLQTLHKNNIYAELITLDGAGHTAINRKDEFIHRMISFLNEKMG